MFDRVMQWLEDESGSQSDGFADDDTRLAIAALFYHMIAVDGVVTPDENQRLRALLSERYALDDKQLAMLARDGEAMDKDSAGLFPFAVILNRQLDEKDRQKIYDQLLELAKADGFLHDLEREMLKHMKVLLKL